MTSVELAGAVMGRARYQSTFGDLMSVLLDQPLGALIEAPATPASDLAEALTIRMAKLTFLIGAVAGCGFRLMAITRFG